MKPLPPSLLAYFDRIGAEVVNFRKAIVKRHVGEYYIEQAAIRIRSDRSIEVSDPAYAPSAQEAVEIAAELESYDFPRTVTARSVDDLLPSLTKATHYFIFWDRKSDEIIHVQERRFTNGKKSFHPWTFTSEGHWEMMEPDGRLPFWKPRYDTGKGKIMIHEGAKAAEFAHDLVTIPLDDPNHPNPNHPWLTTLKEYEHWGLIGGALAPHRANWDELKQINPREVVYASDRDNQGQNTLQKVSNLWGHKLIGVFYGEDFPNGWDIADDIPPSLIKNKRYNGPSFNSLKRPATWATRQVQHPTSKGRVLNVISEEFAEEWMHCLKPKVFIHRDWPHEMYDTETFNNKVRPYSNVDDTARLLIASDANKATKLEYDPSSRSGIFPVPEGGTFINTHCPSPIFPEPGDASLFLDFMDYLVPDPDDRQELLRWCATLVCRPQIKMHYGVLLISETQGVGKSTLGEKILAPLVGRLNVSVASENDLFNSPFNYWLAHKRLTIINEVYQGNSFKAYNALKSLVTDDYVTVNQKFMPTYTIQNWIHFFACSNSRRALKMEDEDRRWFLPKITEKARKGDFWTKLNNWFTEEGGLQIIRHYFEEWLTKNEPVISGIIAPQSTLKKEIMRDGLSATQDAVLTLLEQTKGDDAFYLDKDLINFIKHKFYDGRNHDKLERPLTIRKLARQHGWFENPTRAYIKEWGIDSAGSTILTNNPELVQITPGEIAKRNLRPINPLETM